MTFIHKWLSKISIVCALFVMFCTGLLAQPVGSEQAQRAAQNFFFEKLSATKSIQLQDIKPELVKMGKSETGIAYYIFSSENPMGFVILAADYSAIPVLGYSLENNITKNQSSESPEFNYWLAQYATQIDAIRARQLPPSKDITQRWQQLENGNNKLESLVAATCVGPLITTTWGQGCNYNAQCPTDAAGSSCGRAVTGCVATAMSQIMRFWSYPVQGNGSKCYAHPSYGSLCANFGTTTYNWSSMPNSIGAANAAVATIMYHAGVSVSMQYSANSSGAYVSDARDAFVNYFKYASDASLVAKSSYTDASWETLLKGQLDINRPMEYHGFGPAGGHSWVCDGYCSDGTFHMNWGWNGSYNGNFTVTNLNPGGYTFNNNSGAIINIHPNTCPSNVTITGTYATSLTESQNWIKSTGTTTIPNTANVRLDATPSVGYVELNAGFSTITGCVFVAQAFNGCSPGMPSISAPTTQNDKSLTHSALTEKRIVVAPNPFQNSTTFTYNLPIDSRVSLTVYNATGQMIEALVNDEAQLAGEYRSVFEAKGLANGFYFYTLKVGNELKTGKLILARQ